MIGNDKSANVLMTHFICIWYLMSFSSQAAVAVDRGSFSRNWASFWFDAPLGRRGDDSPWRCGYLKTSTTSSRHRGSEVALVMMMLLMRMMMMMMMVVVMMMGR